MSALFVTSCAVQRSTEREVSRFKIQDSRELTARDSVSVEVLDSVVEVTTITIDRNEVGDTLKVVQVTDRTRAKAKSDVKSRMVDVRVVHDTVFVAMRDSSNVKTTNLANPTNGKSGGLVSALRWIFWIIVALAGLVIIIKIRR